MSTLEEDKLFTGSVPEVYQTLLVPLIFVPYAKDLAARVAGRAPSAVLEIAAGTGVLTRELAERLPESSSITATDLNQPMLEQAARLGTRREVRWQQADAMRLPFEDASFDAVVCQFGAMFFPDRAAAYAQARRVLRPGGAFIFSTWDRIETNEAPHEVHRALVELYPDNPPSFMERTPHGYFDERVIREDLARAGFTTTATITTLTERSRAASARVVAEAFCKGTPIRGMLEARGPGELERATAVAEAAVARRFGRGEIEGAIRALVVEIEA